MSDALKSKELLRRYSIARIPFVAINTIERGRALSILKEISDDLNLPFYVHTLSRGLYDWSRINRLIRINPCMEQLTL